MLAFKKKKKNVFFIKFAKHDLICIQTHIGMYIAACTIVKNVLIDGSKVHQVSVETCPDKNKSAMTTFIFVSWQIAFRTHVDEQCFFAF